MNKHFKKTPHTHKPNIDKYSFVYYFNWEYDLNSAFHFFLMYWNGSKFRIHITFNEMNSSFFNWCAYSSFVMQFSFGCSFVLISKSNICTKYRLEKKQSLCKFQTTSFTLRHTVEGKRERKYNIFSYLRMGLNWTTNDQKYITFERIYYVLINILAYELWNEVPCNQLASLQPSNSKQQ